MMSPGTLRVIIDKARAGAMNMGIDQALLEAAEAGRIPPTLRFYRWDAPTISLGYFQKACEIDDQTEAVRGMPFVRRPTGGGAILHDDEITYSLTLPLASFAEPPGIEEMYRLVHDAFIKVLADRGIEAVYRGGKDPEHSLGGPFFCFARSYSLDITLEGEKLLGSAQRRLRNAVMQHGSFILRRTHTEQPSSELLSRWSGAFDLPGFSLRVAEKIAGKLGLFCDAQTFTQEELEGAEEPRKKYASEAWNQRL